MIDSDGITVEKGEQSTHYVDPYFFSAPITPEETERLLEAEGFYPDVDETQDLVA